MCAMANEPKRDTTFLRSGKTDVHIGCPRTNGSPKSHHMATFAATVINITRTNVKIPK
jgi:hypothetical protein